MSDQTHTNGKRNVLIAAAHIATTISVIVFLVNVYERAQEFRRETHSDIAVLKEQIQEVRATNIDQDGRIEEQRQSLNALEDELRTYEAHDKPASPATSTPARRGIRRGSR
jgi:hypothetical protein